MANVLGELFGEIATSIRGGLGDIGKMSPSVFPGKIDEIVGLISDSTEEIDDILDVINGEVVGENLYTVTFMSYDGSETYGTIQVVENDSCPDPVTTRVFAEPTRESTKEYNFTFVGWSQTPDGANNNAALDKITRDITLYAGFSRSLRKYRITFYDGDAIYRIENVYFGSTPAVPNPEKYGYVFTSWEPEIQAVTGDASYYAQWFQGTFSSASWSEIAKIGANGLAAQTFSVGDVKAFTFRTNAPFNTINAAATIIGFDHDDLADGTGKAPISLMLSAAIDLAFTFSEKGNDTEYTTWDISSLRTAIASLLDVMPPELQAVIKPVVKVSRAKLGSLTSVDSLWALSNRELRVFGSTGGYGEPYELFATSDNRPLPLFGGTENVKYYLRDYASTYYHMAVGTEGSVNNVQKGVESAYIHFGFCI